MAAGKLHQSGQTTKTLRASHQEAALTGISAPEPDPIATTRPWLARSLSRIPGFSQARGCSRSELLKCEEFRALMQSCPIGIFAVDSAAACAYINPCCRDILGLPETVIPDVIWSESILPQESREIVKSWGECVRRGESFVREFRISHPQRGIRWVSLRSVPMSAKREARGTHVAVVEDITDRKQSDDSLRRYADRLEILRELDTSTSCNRSPKAIAELALSRIRDLVKFEWGCIAQFNSNARNATILTASAAVANTLKSGTILPAKEFASPFPAQTPMLWIGDLSRLPQQGSIARTCKAAGTQTCLFLPLALKGRASGMMVLAVRTSARFTAKQLDEIGREADLLALRILRAGNAQPRTGRKQLESLSRRFVQSQEEERRRIAGELHDEIGQGLTALKINLERIARHSPSGAIVACLKDCHRLIEHTIEQVRDISVGLRPSLVDDLGLVAALRWHVDQVARRSGLVAHFAADSLPEALPDDIAIACYRVTQEALNNVVRHAHAREVRVELHLASFHLHLSIQDDGVGFDIPAAHSRAACGGSFGLLGMEERVLMLGGCFKIRSALKKGTQVHARFYLNGPAGKKQNRPHS